MNAAIMAAAAEGGEHAAHVELPMDPIWYGLITLAIFITMGLVVSVVEGHLAPPLIWQSTDAESVSWAAPSTPSTTATSLRPVRFRRPSTSTRWSSSPRDGRIRRTSKRSAAPSTGI